VNSTDARSALTYWLTGLPGSGKSTLSSALADALRERGQACVVIDGDVVRRGLSADLGFSADDRSENVRRVAELAKLLNDSRVVAIVALISPRASDRSLARGIAGNGRFIEVYVDAPLAICEARDPKGMYREARAGRLPRFTGVASPYEAPLAAELRLRTAELDVADCVRRLLDIENQLNA
jgi:adenylylsulfate kinase